MMLIGRVRKEKASLWSAEVDSIGAVTQGTSREDAKSMLASLIQLEVDTDGFAVTIADWDGDAVLVEANRPALLAARLLKHQRELSGMSLADVAKKTGAASRNAYAAYEQGRTEPTLSKLRELLAVVAPGFGLSLVQRKPTSARRAAKRRRDYRRAS